MSANEEAVGLLERAMELLMTLPDSLDRDERELALPVSAGITSGVRASRRALAIAENLPDDATVRVLALMEPGPCLHLAGNLTTGREHLRQAYELQDLETSLKRNAGSCSWARTLSWRRRPEPGCHPSMGVTPTTGHHRDDGCLGTRNRRRLDLQEHPSYDPGEMLG